MEENSSINNSGNNQNFYRWNLLQTTKKKIYSTNKTDVYHIDDIWSLDILDLKDYGPEKNSYRYVLVIIDSFSKFAWTIPLKNKSAQTIKDSFKIVLISSKRKP